MRLSFLFFFLFTSLIHLQGQVDADDTHYLEDQFYMGITYNLLLEKPNGVEQRNLPYGVQLGYVKDIPLNTARTIGFGIGLGYAVNSYYTNIGAEETATDINYDLLDIDFKRSKIETHTIEMPFEFRWRNSTADEYKFWRVYAGAKLGYVFGARSKLVTKENKTSFNNTDVRNLQYGLTLNFGYNTWNVHVYYQLSSLFNDGVIISGGEQIKVKPLRIGIIFYIL